MTTKPAVINPVTYTLRFSRWRAIKLELRMAREWYAISRAQGYKRLQSLRYAYMYRNECLFDIM